MQKGEVKPQHSLSIRSEDERNVVKQLLARFRQLPADQQHKLPALLNGLGKLQIGSGDFDGARQTFLTVAQNSRETTAQAEAQFNAYRAALEEKKWGDALAAIEKAASLDAQRFAPFPLQRYQAKRILGAGGFGTAFLCLDRFFNSEVVVKTLHDAALERNLNDVFREAQVLGQLRHPAIIGVKDCTYADVGHLTRPYIVMDYFPGSSMENFVQQRGTIAPDDLIVVANQIAQAMQAAHQQNILHRDLKPDNVLLRKEGRNWKVKVIDFGLALTRQPLETSKAVRSTGNTALSDSVAGTMKYAPPEQTGELKGVKAGPYSDVYAFGKLCCFAMFKTTEPKDRHWKAVPENLRTGLKEMLDKCREEELEYRLPNFEPVLKVLQALSLTQQRVGVQQQEPQLAQGGSPPKAANTSQHITKIREVGAIRCFEGFTAWVLSVAFSPKEFHALSGSADGLVQLWNVGTGNELRRLTGHADMVRTVSFAPGGRYAISASGARWKDGGRTITAGSDYHVRLWDLESGKEVRCLGGHTAPIYCAAFSPDGQRILSCGFDSHFNNWLSGVVDNSIRLWDAKTGKALRRLKGHTHGVRSVAFSADGRYAVSGSADKSVRLWDLASGQEVRGFLGHEQDVCPFRDPTMVMRPDRAGAA
jgi:tRNA A-37 threonylcarbamoyl transferase component Bud32